MKKPVQNILLWMILFILHYSCTKDETMDSSDTSAYISDVFEYKYAPGQHASLIPADWKGSGFIGKPWINNKSFTSLGGWGGYIIAGFNHTVRNVPGKDFAVFTQPGPASEPAVIFVMADSNGDHLPNDGEWIELRGSEFQNPETIHNYQVTYHKPSGNDYVTWNDNLGNDGSLIPQFQSSTWWWQGYGDVNQVTFSGIKLPDAYLNNSTTDTENWVPRPGLFSYGYGECYGNSDYDPTLKANLFDLSNAVDSSGNPVSLEGIRFIKVQSSVFQIAGWLNEISAEVSGAVDLSLLK